MKIQWFALMLSIIGIFLNALKIIWCWPIWILSNILWIIYCYHKKDKAQLILWSVFSLANLYGWIMWLQK